MLLQREMAMPGLLQLRMIMFDFVGVQKAVELVVGVVMMPVSCFPGGVLVCA
jgi:hypothetical protein